MFCDPTSGLATTIKFVNGIPNKAPSITIPAGKTYVAITLTAITGSPTVSVSAAHTALNYHTASQVV